MLLEEHGEAIEYDLLAMGRSLDDLGTLALSWRDLLVLVRQAPPGSALRRSQDPQMDAWNSGAATSWLLAVIADLLSAGNWQRQGKRNATKPKPLPRPGKDKNTERYGSKPIPVKDFDEWWDSQNEE